ncbi:AraC family transcriptional regulator [Chitinophaga sp. SYP-B3965]|uniref:AraC family transcriptional regulator n=1 Tax=Chitinophaga sp. SYP-B3965 TaxID=2663120 RepID=UPI001565C324|nr:AraC family transcriptional regulator [Chitinophaga sp. SYP-B3965]
MRFIIKGIPETEITIITEIPSQYRSYIYPYAQAVLEESTSINILHQVMQINGFTVCNHVFFPKKDTLIAPHSPEPLSALHFTMKGSIRCELADAGSLWLRAGQFGFFQVSNASHKAWLEKGGVYESFHIDFSREQLFTLSAYSDLMKKLLDKSDKNQSTYLTSSTGIMTSKFYELINEIRRTPSSDKMREIEMPANISLLLALTLKDTEESSPSSSMNDDALLFTTIHAYILNNLSRELGNQEIARDYNISVSKLKTGYKKIYAESLQSFVKRARLETARELILTTNLSMHKISEMVGYGDYGNFSRRYRAHFGHPPSEVIRR